MNRYDTNASFVMADQAPTVATPETSLIRRQDVVEVTGKMIDGYMTQQRGLLDQVQGETTHAGFLSGADQVAERRRTSGMYPVSYTHLTRPRSDLG